MQPWMASFDSLRACLDHNSLANCNSMDALSLAAFEERAAAAEARLAIVESAVLGKGSSIDAAALADVKGLLVQAREETAKLQEERDKAVEENAKLKYQVLHLKRGVQEADKQLAAHA